MADTQENKRLRELKLEQFRKEGIDEDIRNPKTRWRELLADLRYMGNSGYPRLIKGEKWGDWALEDLKRYFARCVDALRSVYFALIPPKKGEKGYDSSYWRLYRLAQKFMKSKPPETPEEAKEWDLKRAKLIKTSHEIGGVYLVHPHAEMIWKGEKTLVVKSKKYDAMTEKRYLVSDSLCYGIIEFEEPKEISIEEFKKLRDEHRITDEEAKEWWNLEI